MFYVTYCDFNINVLILYKYVFLYIDNDDIVWWLKNN